MWWHLDWKFSLVISTWSLDELLKFVFILKWVFLIFVLNWQKCIAFYNFILIHQRNRAMTKHGLLLGDDFSCFVWLQSQWNTFLWGEDNVIDESSWTWKEHLLLSWTLEVVEDILVEETIFRIMSALDQMLCVLPGDWAEVCELWKTCLEKSSVTMDIIQLAWSFITCTFASAVAVTSGESLSSTNIHFYCCHGGIFHEPLALETIDFNQWIVNSLIEWSNKRKIGFQVSESLGKNGSEGCKISILEIFSSLIDLLNGYSSQEYIGWNNTKPSHLSSLSSCPWEVF